MLRTNHATGYSTIEPPPGDQSQATNRSAWTSGLLPLLLIASATIVIHALTGNRYGFHRDELATLDDARHLAWGFVAYPPITPFFGRLSLMLFGESLTGFRFFAALAQAIAVLLAGLMARELGGGRNAQLMAPAAGIPFCLAGGALMQYVSFDYLFWVLTAYFVVRLLRSEDHRWWLAIGVSVGLGMMAKYTMLLFALSLIVGLLLTPARRLLATRWLWVGVAVVIIIALPNFTWQARHSFVTLDFLKHIHARDVRMGRTKDFLPDQLKLMLLAAPLALTGLVGLFSPAGRRFRPLAWMYLIPLVLFFLMKGRGYYLAAAYPMLYAAGAVFAEQWFRSQRRAVALILQWIAWAALLFDIGAFAYASLPLFKVDSPRGQAALQKSGDFREELGWPELVQTVAAIRDTLPADERTHFGVLAGNYGEAGAIDLYGPRYKLPNAISGINSFWERGYGNPAPQTVIAVGLSRDWLQQDFTSCRIAGHTSNQYGVPNEETVDHPDILVCTGLRHPWSDFWSKFRSYG